MRKIKHIIPVVLLFMVIGFATINYTLSIDGDIELTGDLSDFKVYFSKLNINGVDSPEAIISDTELYVSGVIDTVGDAYIVDYDITNASKLFDANITMNCTGASDYLSFTNNFDTTNTLSALSTRSGTLVFTKIKTIASTDSFNFNVSCKFVASPVERDTFGSGEVPVPLNPYYIGREVSIGTEKFNIISTTEDTISMLAQYNVSEYDHKQVTSQENTYFAVEGGGWEYYPGPKEIELLNYSSAISNVLSYYKYYLNETDYSLFSANLITLNQLKELGCDVPDDYSSGDFYSCENSVYKNWLINGQYWWTRSAVSNSPGEVWLVWNNGRVINNICNDNYGVRPVITISKSVLSNLDLSASLISFSIMGTTYQAREGMTWGKWVESDYNSSKYYVISGDMITDSGGYPVTYGGINVGISEKIVANRDYENYS